MSVRDLMVVRILVGIAAKIWAASSAAILTCIIIYFFYGTFTALFLLFITILAVLYQAQDNMLYQPDMPQHSRVYVPLPSMYGLPFESVNIRSTDNVTLHAFWIRHNGEKGGFVPTMIYFHGNAGNIGHRLQNAHGFFHTCQCNILLVEYRGYGLSTGIPSERGFCADARSAIEYLHTRHDLDLNQIVLFGRSLGGAVAIDLAVDSEYSQKIMCLIVENTFTGIPEMAVELLHDWLKYLPICCYKNKFTSIFKIQFSATPCLFISGLADALVPSKMMTQLHSNCGSLRKELFQIAGGTHNETWTVGGYYEGLVRFLSVCKETRGPLQTPPKPNRTERLLLIENV